nr:RNA-dependent RNA polymerase [Leishmania RNA virus 2]
MNWESEFNSRVANVVKLLRFDALVEPCGGESSCRIGENIYTTGRPAFHEKCVRKFIIERFNFIEKITGRYDRSGQWGIVNDYVFSDPYYTNTRDTKIFGITVTQNNLMRVLFIFACILLFCSKKIRALVTPIIEAELAVYKTNPKTRVCHEMRATAALHFIEIAATGIDLPQPDPDIIAGESIGHKYKLKPHVGASTKVNIHASEVIAGCRKHARVVYRQFVEMSGLFTGMYDDQVAAILLYCTATHQRSAVDISMAYAIAAVKDTTLEAISDLSDALKSGALAAWCANYVELKCLRGRGVAELDVIDEAKQRLRKPIHPYAFTGKEDLLRFAIQRVFAEELPCDRVILRTKDDFWSSRWLWAANGGHSRALEHAHPELKTRKEVRAYRKCVLEQWKNNPMDAWDGQVYVTPSQKLEHGKSRLLLACDTLSYLWFEYYLKPVETAWLNIHTLLNPGVVNHYSIAKKLENKLADAKDVENDTESDMKIYSLDFEDFNSQHSLEAQQMVFEELFKHIGIENDDTRRIIDSFKHMIIYNGKEPLGRVHGTLMSGHRATTFINTVLNTAYLYAAGLRVDFSYHVGDDVIFQEECRRATCLYTELRVCGVRCNPHKQCASEYSGEFLRVAHTKRYSAGYVARAVASCVSGNWVSDHILDRREALTNAISCIRTIINRTGLDEGNPIGRVVAKSVAKRCCVEEKYISKLLYGKACLGDGVIYGMYCSSATKIDINVNIDYEHTRTFKYETFATADYLRHHTSLAESVMLQQYGADIADIMAQSSWMKSMEASSRVSPSNMRITLSRGDLGVFVIPASEVERCPVREGVFEKYPLLMMIKERIPLREALDLARAMGYYCPRGCAEELWGSSMRLCTIDGVLPYADACQLARRIPCNGVRLVVDHNVYA